MFSLSFDAAALGLLAACEVVARSIWPELFEEPAPSPPEAVEGDGRDVDRPDDMAIW